VPPGARGRPRPMPGVERDLGRSTARRWDATMPRAPSRALRGIALRGAGTSRGPVPPAIGTALADAVDRRTGVPPTRGGALGQRPTRTAEAGLAEGPSPPSRPRRNAAHRVAAPIPANTSERVRRAGVGGHRLRGGGGDTATVATGPLRDRLVGSSPGAPSRAFLSPGTRPATPGRTTRDVRYSSVMGTTRGPRDPCARRWAETQPPRSPCCRPATRAVDHRGGPHRVRCPLLYR
jgi:hypothetical protein